MSDGMLTGIVKTSKFCEFQANRNKRTVHHHLIDWRTPACKTTT
jgi:hypothetical protein